MVRPILIAAMMLGVLPAVASADHYDSGRFSIGVGIGFRGGYYDYGRRYDHYYGPRVSYGVSVYEPAPIYCPPPAVVYEAPAVYCPPPVVYAPPVTYSTTVVVPSPYVRVGVPYYSHTRYYYGR